MYIYWCNNCERRIKGKEKRVTCSYCGGSNIILQGIPLAEINGLGVIYIKKLQEANIMNVHKLVRAEPEGLSIKTGISLKRIKYWIESAQIMDPDFKYEFKL